MSEYQYYDFLAIDRPLTPEEISALRRLSTRAHITSVSFSNEYHWGSFKGNPSDLMRRFFDAHVYVANWMTAVFMVRLPIETIPKEMVRNFAVKHVLDFEATETHMLITWSLDESENYDRFGMEDGRGWMARLASVRDELLRGDFRSLYIGWLAAVTSRMMDDDDVEPHLLEGLGNLTAAQEALAEFLEVDRDLLAGAGMGSPDPKNENSRQKEMDEWLNELPRDEALLFLKQLLEGQALKAERTIKNRFFAWQRNARKVSDELPRRTVEELWKSAEKAAERRREREKHNREMLAIKRRQERDAFLAALARNFPKAWEQVRQNIERGSGAGYDEACRGLVDLSEAYAAHSSRKEFNRELQSFMADHLRRKALIQRLVKAGIWHGEG